MVGFYTPQVLQDLIIGLFELKHIGIGVLDDDPV